MKFSKELIHILISDTVARYVRDDFSLVPMKETQVKGVDSPVRVYSVERYQLG